MGYIIKNPPEEKLSKAEKKCAGSLGGWGCWGLRAEGRPRRACCQAPAGWPPPRAVPEHRPCPDCRAATLPTRRVKKAEKERMKELEELEKRERKEKKKKEKEKK